VLALNRQIARQTAADWHRLLSTRHEALTRCWDHIATTSATAGAGRHHPWREEGVWFNFGEQRWRVWQWAVDRRARIEVGVGREVVVVLSVSSGHPKANE